MGLPIGPKSNLGPIWLRFRDISAFVRQKLLFPYPTHIPAKISGCFLWIRSTMLVSEKANAPS